MGRSAGRPSPHLAALFRRIPSEYLGTGRAGGTRFGCETVVEALDLDDQAERLAALFTETKEETGM